jgi:hypothetical protein
MKKTALFLLVTTMGFSQTISKQVIGTAGSKQSVLNKEFLSTQITALQNAKVMPGNYFPLSDENYWNYDVQQVNPNAINTSLGIDQLYVSNDTLIGNTTYKKMKTIATPKGYFSNTLRNNAVRIVDSYLLVKGFFNLSIPSFNPIQINLSDFIIFDENALADAPLDITSGTTSAVSTSNNTVSFTVNYTLTSVAQETLASYTSNGVTYPNVKKTRLILNLSIYTLLSQFPVYILADQPVLTMDEYFANEVGNIYTNSYYHYDMDAFFANQFGIPTSVSQTEEEFLTTYQVLSAEEQSLDLQIKVYPNPAKDQITIDCGNKSVVIGLSYKMVNTLGQEVLNGFLNSQQNIVQLNNIKGQGVYFVKIYDNSNNLMDTKKIIIE